jgi:hypothetical protein
MAAAAAPHAHQAAMGTTWFRPGERRSGRIIMTPTKAAHRPRSRRSRHDPRPESQGLRSTGSWATVSPAWVARAAAAGVGCIGAGVCRLVRPPWLLALLPAPVWLPVARWVRCPFPPASWWWPARTGCRRRPRRLWPGSRASSRHRGARSWWGTASVQMRRARLRPWHAVSDAWHHFRRRPNSTFRPARDRSTAKLTARVDLTAPDRCQDKRDQIVTHSSPM